MIGKVSLSRWGGAISTLAIASGIFALLIITRDRAPEGTSASDRGCGGPMLVQGDRIPGECKVELLYGGVASIADIRESRPMLLNYWASWCSYCIAEMPDIERVFKEAEGEVAFLGLDLLGVEAETKEAARRLAQQTGVTYPLAFDEDGLLYFRLVPRMVRRPPMPTTVIIDAHGVIVNRWFGPMNTQGLKAQLHDTLGIVIG